LIYKGKAPNDWGLFILRRERDTPPWGGGERDVIIRQRLGELGLEISKSKLSAMWRKPFYAGIIVNSLLEKPVKGTWEPMVSEIDFLRLNTVQNNSKKVLYASEVIHLERPLSRFVICGNCGGYLTGYENKKKGLLYYKCNKCTKTTFNARQVGKSRTVGLNEAFSDLLIRFGLREDLVEPFKLQLKKFFEFNYQDLISTANILEREILECDSKLKALDERFWLSSVDLPAEKYKAYQAQILQQRAEKESRLHDLKNKLSNSSLFIEEAVDIARNLQYYWVSSDVETKLKLQKTVFPSGLVIIPTERRYLTKNVNDFFRRIPVFTRTLNWGRDLFS